MKKKDIEWGKLELFFYGVISGSIMAVIFYSLMSRVVGLLATQSIQCL